MKLARRLRFIRTPQPQLWLLIAPRTHLQMLERYLQEALFQAAPFISKKNADLYVVGEEFPCLVKRIRTQKPADYLRRYLNPQGKREYYGSMRLAAEGFRVPDAVGYAINLLPWSRYDSMFFCRYLAGSIRASRYVLDENDRAKRQAVLMRAGGDVAAMLNKHLYHKDGHLGNVLMYPENPECLYWIDNDVQFFAPGKRAEYEARLVKKWSRLGRQVGEASELLQEQLSSRGSNTPSLTASGNVKTFARANPLLSLRF